MAIIQAEDPSGGIELICFPRGWAKLKHSVLGDVIIASVKIGSRDGERSYILEDAKPVEVDRGEATPGQFFGVYLPETFRGPQKLSKLKGVLLSHSGRVPVRVYLSRSSVMDFDFTFLVEPSEALNSDLVKLFQEVN